MKLWDGRFKEKTDPLMERFSVSINFDWKLYEEDIEGSIAHAEMLEKIGILTEKEKEEIIKGLHQIKKEIENNEFKFSDALEDIHMHIETRLTELIGETGRKLHTGRSRNDQISLDMRLFVKRKINKISKRLIKLLKTIIVKAENEKDTLMPGYTHMQRAQVVTFSHYILAYYFMFKRDLERLKAIEHAVDVLPLGSGALAGSTIPLDREYVKKRLGFSRISQNSMDTVSDRDFCLEVLFAISMIMLHLSRFSEDMIIFSTEEFSFVSLPDSLCTGSSLMPHKKNPDALELIRGKTSRVIGDLFSLFLLMKGLPLTYNRDMQEDKEPLFHAIETVCDSMDIACLCIEEMNINKENMKRAVYESFMPAVEMAEYLTQKGIPFREAHTIVGKMVSYCEEKGIKLHNMDINEMRVFSEVFEEDIYDFIEPYNILKNRKTTGSASFHEVEKTIENEKTYLSSL